MCNRRLVHDAALMMAQHCTEAMVNLLTEEQQIQAKECFYEICQCGLEAYELQVDRMHKRLRPLDN